MLRSRVALLVNMINMCDYDINILTNIYYKDNENVQLLVSNPARKSFQVSSLIFLASVNTTDGENLSGFSYLHDDNENS